jgi:hypothetical protein
MQAFTRMDMVETERGDGVKERGMQAGRYVDFSLTQTEVKCESSNVLPITTDWRGGVPLERHPLHLYQFIEPAQCSHSPLPPQPPPPSSISFHFISQPSLRLPQILSHSKKRRKDKHPLVQQYNIGEHGEQARTRSTTKPIQSRMHTRSDAGCTHQ